MRWPRDGGPTVEVIYEVMSGAEQLQQQLSGCRCIIMSGVGFPGELDPIVTADRTQTSTSGEIHRAEPRRIWKADVEPLKLSEQERMVESHIVASYRDTPRQALKEFSSDISESRSTMDITSAEPVNVGRTQISFWIDQSDKFPDDGSVEASHYCGHLHDAMMPLREETSSFDVNDCDVRHMASLLEIQYIQASG